MTVPNLPNFAVFIGSGSTGPFTFSFPFLDNSEIISTVTDLSGNVTIPLIAVLTGAGTDTGGVITLVNPLAAGFVLTITRVLIIDQQTELPDGGPFFAATIEAALDYLTMICQQLETEIQATHTVATVAGSISYIEGNANLGVYTVQYSGNGELVVWKIDPTANIVKILPPAGWTISGLTEFDLRTQYDRARFFPSPTSNNLVRVG
jgi:hypothetical protein